MTTSMLAIVNGKGGCGKTSCAANLAAIWASERRRVLAVDLDAQGNLAVDFGVEDTDAGLALSLAVQGGPAIDPVRDVRPGLDLVAGGTRTDQLAAALGAHRNPRDAILDVVAVRGRGAGARTIGTSWRSKRRDADLPGRTRDAPNLRRVPCVPAPGAQQASVRCSRRAAPAPRRRLRCAAPVPPRRVWSGADDGRCRRGTGEPGLRRRTWRGAM